MRFDEFKRYSNLLFRPWKFWIVGLISIIGFYDLFLSQFLSDTTREKFPRVSDLFIHFGWDWYNWIIIILVFLLFSFLEGTFRYIRQRENPPEIEMLLDLRKEGVELRNEGERILHFDQVRPWWDKHLDWRSRTADTIKLVDVNKCNKWKTLDTFKPKRKFASAFNQDVQKKLQMFDEWLSRLDSLIDDISK